MDSEKRATHEPCMPLDEVIIAHINKALILSNGKIAGKDGAAHILGINPSTLRGKMRKYKISQNAKS